MWLVLVWVSFPGWAAGQGRGGNPPPDQPNPDVASVVKLAAKAPPLPPPRGRVVGVKTAAELINAVNHSPAGTTIMLAEGEYRLSERLLVRQDGLALVGAGDREKVILDRGGAKDDCIFVGGAKDVVIAGLTVRNCEQGVAIKGEEDTQRTHVYNCKFHNITQRMVKGTKPAWLGDETPSEKVLRTRPSGGIIRYCLFLNDQRKTQADDGFNGDYVAGIDMMWLNNWTISDNVFIGIRGRTGGGRGAVFLWQHSQDVTIERNVFVNCDRAICLGNPSGASLHVKGGVIRNNFIVTGVGNAMEICRTQDTKVYNNTILAQPAGHATSVHFFQGSKGDEFFNNIVAGQVDLEPSVASDHNLVGKYDGGFANPAIGDLHLVGRAANIGKGRAVPGLTDDFDGQNRNALPDIGAHEIHPAPGPGPSAKNPTPASGPASQPKKPDVPTLPKGFRLF